MPGGARWGVLFTSRWVSVEHLFVLLPYVCEFFFLGKNVSEIMGSPTERLFSLPAWWGALPPPPINFCSPGFDYTTNVLLRGVIADLMEANGRPALSQEALLSRTSGRHPRWPLKLCVASGIRTRTGPPF
jgi:hypothetical protein